MQSMTDVLEHVIQALDQCDISEARTICEEVLEVIRPLDTDLDPNGPVTEREACLLDTICELNQRISELEGRR